MDHPVSGLRDLLHSGSRSGTSLLSAAARPPSIPSSHLHERTDKYMNELVVNAASEASNTRRHLAQNSKFISINRLHLMELVAHSTIRDILH